jgi:hypothetical protein
MSQTRSKIWRVVLVALIGLASLNLWTGGPLLALWVGSRTQWSGPPTMLGLFVVTIVLTAVSLGLIRLIALLQEAHRKLSGDAPQVRAHTPWLRSMRGERPVYPGESRRLTAPERMLVLVVMIAVIAFEVWFFFFSGSPIDQRSGRGDRYPSPVTTASAKPSYPLLPRSESRSRSGAAPGPARRRAAAGRSRAPHRAPHPRARAARRGSG